LSRETTGRPSEVCGCSGGISGPSGKTRGLLREITFAIGEFTGRVGDVTERFGGFTGRFGDLSETFGDITGAGKGLHFCGIATDNAKILRGDSAGR